MTHHWRETPYGGAELVVDGVVRAWAMLLPPGEADRWIWGLPLEPPRPCVVGRHAAQAAAERELGLFQPVSDFDPEPPRLPDAKGPRHDIRDMPESLRALACLLRADALETPELRGDCADMLADALEAALADGSAAP